MQKVVAQPLPAVANARWQHEACEAVRLHLCQHSNTSFHPRQRDENHRVRDVPHDQHARAFLEHYAHASEIFKLFLAYAGVANANNSHGFK